MNNEYVIINKTAIQKRIKEFQIKSMEIYYREGIDEYDFAKDELDEILSQSTPLIPVVERVFNAGYIRGYDVGHWDAKSHPLALTIAKHIHKDRQEYISNLKLDI